MKIILIENVSNLGQTGDIVTVTDGYARNYLIPRSLAVIADEKNVKQINHKKRQLEHKFKKQLEGLKEFAKKIESAEIHIIRKAGDNGKLFGSVTNQDIHAALKAQGIEIDRHAIVLNEPIKAVGTHKVKVKLARELDATLKCLVIAEKSENNDHDDKQEAEIKVESAKNADNDDAKTAAANS